MERRSVVPEHYEKLEFLKDMDRVAELMTS